jgi:peptidoglycan/xylan/chitin deacetylase (PgdA/CDA1 family)
MADYWSSEIGSAAKDSITRRSWLRTAGTASAAGLVFPALFSRGEAAFPRTLTIGGTGSYASYSLTVSGGLEARSGLTDEDEISGSSASGAVGGGRDSYRFSGEIVAFDFDGEADLFVDGERTDPATLFSRSLTVVGSGSYSSYNFTVSDSLVAAGGLTGEDETSGSSASGAVASGRDRYAFAGEVIDLDIDGDATVLVDGDPADLRLPNTLAIKGGGSYTSYSFTVSGDVEAGGGLTTEDEISGSSASGAVGGGRDNYRFSGEITAFDLDGDGTVFLNGERVDPASLGDTDDANDLKLGYDARARSHDLGNTYEDFGDFSAGWEPKQGEIASNGGPGGDWERPADDAGHATLISDGSNNRVEMVNDTFSENFAYRDVSMAVRLRGVSNETLRVELAAGDGSEKQVTTRYLSEKHGWVRMSLSPSAWTGTPDMADINELSISCYTGGKSCEIDVDDIRTTPKRGNGAVLFTFDDGNETDYTIAYDELSARGMAGTSAVIPRMVGNGGKLSSDQLDAMHGGDWAVCLHPQHGQGLGSVSEDQAREWIEENKQWQLDNGYTRGADTLIWPFGDFDEDALNIAGEYCNLSFGGGSSSVGGTITEASWVPRVELNEDDDAAKAREMIELAYKTDTVVVFMTHRMGGSNLSRSTFADLLDQVEYRGLDVLTTDEFAAEQ